MLHCVFLGPFISCENLDFSASATKLACKLLVKLSHELWYSTVPILHCVRILGLFSRSDVIRNSKCRWFWRVVNFNDYWAVPVQYYPLELLCLHYCTVPHLRLQFVRFVCVFSRTMFTQHVEYRFWFPVNSIYVRHVYILACRATEELLNGILPRNKIYI